MIMTTPNEFLQFAKEMGLGRIKSTSSSPRSSPLSRSMSTNDGGGYTSTGLAVLNNLCRLIEQIHQLKAENHRLRAHLDLVEHVDKFHQHFFIKDAHKYLTTSTSIPYEDKSPLISRSSSLKVKRSLSNRERKERSFRHQRDESSFILPIDHEQNELSDQNSSSPSVAAWSKVRHAFKFSLRRKQDPPLIQTERQQIPTISISIESDDDQLQDSKYSKKKKKKIASINENRQGLVGEETDQDDESTQLVRNYHRGRLDGNETTNSSSIDRQEPNMPINSVSNPSNIDDEQLLTRKQSKIAHYRRKLRSKLDTVKRQFSEQSPTSSMRRFPNACTTTFDEIGSGLNRALLTQQLAPALTKSYQQKMREWQTMQKSNFLVTYRRQSITPKMDLNISSQKLSIIPISPEISSDQMVPLSPMTDELNLELEKPIGILGPILSPNQRSLIVHQWREIMSEEISLRYYNEYLQQKMNSLKQLEEDLKSLKTNIFCTNQLIKPQSMINLHQTNPSSSLQRCRSLDSFSLMPASWSLAVQSAAYSDVLDGTSTKTTDRAILFNRNFFDRLENFKYDRYVFEKNLQLRGPLKMKPKTVYNEKRGPIRCCLRKLSLISSSEFPEHFLPDAIIPLQTILSNIPLTSNNELKSAKRSRFDLKKSFQRSRSMYLTQFHSWLQRRRQQQNSPLPRRRSDVETKESAPPKLLGSPRLARIHQKFFKTSASSSPQISRKEIPIQIADDSDNRSLYELPVRIYFPPFTSPTIRRVRIDENHITTFDNNQEDPPTPVFDRKYPSFKATTAKERRESFLTLSNLFNNRHV